MKVFFSIACLFLFTAITAQSHKVKAGVLGLPLFQSGFGMGAIGIEALNKNSDKSIQLSLNISGGSFAVDAETTSRKWITLERIVYFNKKETRNKLFLSFFVESGIRKITPGFAHFEADSILNHKKAFEINPGVSGGVFFKIKKKWGIELVTGPKLIFASYNDRYYNSLTKEYFYDKYKEVKPGYRFMINFSYQL